MLTIMLRTNSERMPAPTRLVSDGAGNECIDQSINVIGVNYVYKICIEQISKAES